MLVGFSQSQYYLQSAVILAHLFKLFFSIWLSGFVFVGR
jgi:hypothetical protein